LGIQKEIAFLSMAIALCQQQIGFISGDGNYAPYAFNLKYLHTSDGIAAVNSATVKKWSGCLICIAWQTLMKE
jgi:hypothetical protein